MVWDDQLRHIRELRNERSLRDQELYAIQLRIRREQAAQVKRQKKQTSLPRDLARVVEIRRQLADAAARSQRIQLELTALNTLPEKIEAIKARLDFVNEQIKSLDEQYSRINQSVVSSQRLPTSDNRIVSELKRQLVELENARRNLQQELDAAANSLENLQSLSAAADQQRAQLEGALIRLQKNVVTVTDELNRALRDTVEVGGSIGEVDSYDTTKRRLQAGRLAVDKAIAQLYNDTAPRDLVPNLSDTIPFLFMPVRIETRFMTGGKTPELWLRIYPDDIAIHTHEEVLTDREVAEGENYWRRLWTASASDDSDAENAKKTAWSELVTQFGSQRAAFIAERTKPTNWGQFDGETAPIFPVQAQTKTSSWSRAPRTTVLPDKFVVMLYDGDKVVHEFVGAQVPDEIFTGPDPLEADDAFVERESKLLFGESFDWMSDFPKAVTMGLGFKIPITAQQATNGFSKVLVMGLSLSSGADESRQMLERLIDNHHYSPKGFGLVRTGTATNNTTEAGSGYTKNDQFNDISYFVETGAPLFNAGDETDGRYLADALGIEYAPLQYVRNSDAQDRREAIAMNTALYPATLGYYFDTLMAPVLSDSAQESLRHFFVERVSGRGSLSAIRVGNQPYGVLLTSNFSQWQWSKTEYSYDLSFLNKLREVLSHYHGIWLSLLGQLNYVGKPGTQGDPGAVLMDVLGLQPGSVSFSQRIGYSTDYLRNLDSFQYGGRYFNDQRQNFASKNNVLNFLQSLGYNRTDKNGLPVVPQLLRILYQHYDTKLDAKNLVDDVPLSEAEVIRFYDKVSKKNYLDWLAEARSIDALERQDFGVGVKVPHTLLYLNLRRALLLQLHKSAIKWFATHNVDVTPALEVANFHNIRPAINLTKWEIMKAKVAVAVPGHPDNAKPVADYLLTTGKSQTEAAYLSQMRDALGFLAGLPTARLERCLTEHLDTCTYRLDSWQSAMFSLRLEHLRRPPLVEGRLSNTQTPRNKGIYLGAYAWVEDLKPGASPKSVRDGVPDKLMPANRAPLYEYASNGGFVHAPSLNQASAAALLRCGYLSDAQSAQPDRMAVNLSSERVRRALFILQGIRNGQSLEALLGYQFERGLHDAASADVNLVKLNEYIYDFREKFPLEQHYLRQQGSEESLESIPPAAVVNGVRLAEAAGDVPYGASGPVTGASAAEKQAIRLQKDRLSDSLDAVKDLLQSESVYQLVQGNFERAAAVANALQESEIPPEIDIINTPRSRQFSFTQRVTLHFDVLDPDKPQSNPWSPIAMSPRARLEPGMNVWLGKMLGPPGDLYCRVAQLDVAGNSVGSEDLTIDRLNLQPIDLVYLIGEELNSGAAQAGAEDRTSATELESRIAWCYREKNNLDDTVPVRIEFFQPSDKQTLGKLLPYLRMLKGLITDARPLHAQDYDPPSKQSAVDKANPQGLFAAELFTRTTALQATFVALLAGIKNRSINAMIPDKDGNLVHYFNLNTAFVALRGAHLGFADIDYSFGEGDALWLRDQLLAIAGLGRPNAFPSQRVLGDQGRKSKLLDQAMAVIGAMDVAAATADDLQAQAGSVTEISNQVELYIRAVKALVGEMFKVLPRFSYNNETDIQLSHSDRAQLLLHAHSVLKMRYPAEEWLQSVAHVRGNLSRWDNLLSLYESFNTQRVVPMPIQLPYRAGDSWLAVEFPQRDALDQTQPFNIEHDTLSIAVHGDAAFLPNVPRCGLLIDDWTEDIPTRNETTGIAFNYDQPNVVPPQALLLAVPPTLKGHWTWDDLVGILNDTLLRAKLRAVEPRLLDKVKKSEVGVLLPAVLADFSQYDLNVSLDYRLNISFVNENAPIKTVMTAKTQ